MTSQWNAPEDEADLDYLPWVERSRMVLNLVGAAYLLLGLVGGPAYGLLFSQDPTLPASFGYVMGGIVGCTGIGMGLANFVASWGLGQRAKWAWIAAVVLGAMYLPSGCMPFGGLVLYGLLQDDSRKAFFR